jgi:16S rRNA (uracil1498-N3)-methyltransferase
MPHFFIPPENIHGARFVLSGTEAHHLVDVRRSKLGDVVHLFDGTGNTYVGKIEQMGREEISGAILEQGQSPVAAVEVHLFQAVPKGDRFDWLVEKSAELGVHSVSPLITARSVVKDISEGKLERWKRLSLAACKQCGRSAILNLGSSVLFPEALAMVKDTAVSIIPWEGEETHTLEELLLPAKARRVNIFIGPEGGFTIDEIGLAIKHGVSPVTLGPRILRAETAGLLASVLALNAYGEFDNKG